VRPATGAPDVDVLHVQGNVYLLATPAGNVAVQIGPTGVLVVDTAVAPLSEKLLAEIRKLSDKQIRYIVNTSVDPEHTGGNEPFAREGGLSGVRNIRNTPGESLTQTARIWAHDNVLQRMVAPPAGQQPAPVIVQPTDTWIGDGRELFFSGESIQMIHAPSAHTDGDTIVYFRRSDVVVAGDILNLTGYPVIDLERGGSLQGVIDGLNKLLDLAIPQHHEEGGTFIIPGHGRICDEFDLVEYRDMVTIVRDRIEDMIKKGMTLAQIQAARPTLDYDPRYGATTGSWTTDRFVEAAWKSLTKSK
jgi:glyoxylase-like metal-dependent hydrolase (beta-lactamase superfamily II)